MGAVMGLGLAAYVMTSDKKEVRYNPIQDACQQQVGPYASPIAAPEGLGYGQPVWDTAYVTAITLETAFDEPIFVANLRFESTCDDGSGTKIVRELRSDEIQALGITTRTELCDYVAGRAAGLEGYIGPNLMI